MSPELSPIAVITDSTADIPPKLLGEFNIHVVPNIIIIDGQSYTDGENISRQEFYTRLPGMNPLPTTSTASAGVYQELYERLLTQGASQIISIHASSLLSGIFNAASIAAQAFGERVAVCDSQHISMGLGFQVLSAAEAVRQGLSVAAILPRLESFRNRVRVVAMLNTLEFVRRSGRVSWARARLGSLLRIKPFVEVREGSVFSLGETRTFRRGLERLRAMLQTLAPLERLAILHTNAEEEARQFLESLSIHLPENPLIVNVTTVIGTHVGPHGIGYAAVVADKPLVK